MGWPTGWPTVVREEHPAVAPVGGMRSTLFVYPQDDLSIVVLSNLQGSNPEWFIDKIAGFYILDMKSENGFGLSKNLKLLRQELTKNDFKNVNNIYKKVGKQNKNFALTEDEINSWGYQLLEHDKKNEALQVFKLNTTLFPNSWNVYDSSGEILRNNSVRLTRLEQMNGGQRENEIRIVIIGVLLVDCLLTITAN